MAAKAKRRIDFSKLAWRSKSPGAPEKRYTKNGKVIRLVRYTDQFTEVDWCDKGHIGMVLSGRMVISFGNEKVEYKAGDALFITPGDRDKHKAEIAPGEEATVLLFEET
ncbi:MAG: cupin domain-containing protein [Geminicoccales bacterium]|jgi:ethanolamine utilization protein EutQ (cupin superfamily)